MSTRTDLPAEFGTALEVFLEGVTDIEVDWALTGSTAFAIQGVPVTPADIDVQTTAPGAYAIEQRFSDRVDESVSQRAAAQIRSHFGALHIGDVRVEIMGDLQKRRPDGTWETPVDIADHRRFVRFREYRVPVLALEYEASAYDRLGRTDRAELLREYSEA